MNKLKKIPMWITAIALILKVENLLSQGLIFDALGWCAVGVWVIFVCYAYSTNRNLPVAGMLNYEAGANQIPRAILTFGLSTLMFISALRDLFLRFV